ncbi:uncharacterized protein F4812DRAFT_444051 [Daldinia caldariorum]|uniref:uncharacterized protein n=1 Tax=Daldinia caldariorum TaxID=326644 RepID=UPI002008A585|nr:uncharacterized protein F4812DRAFT_444051 [Daldinia caldariorum]KAI1463973.1 hypothetical protein F4812DRAFT_444051 [Daldinia caldariorum]
MAGQQNRKRQRADEPPPSNIEPPTKKAKTRIETERKAWESRENHPKFYDRLSKISLTHGALKELNRRTRSHGSHGSHPSPPAHPITDTLTCIRPPLELVRFSRHGGPDLHDLRGYPHPLTDHPHHIDMIASRSSRSRNTRNTRSIDPASTPPTTTTAKTKKSTPYDRNFDLHLTNHGVHQIYTSEEPDLEDITAALSKPRPSLSPSRFSDGAFKAFQQNDVQARDEDDVLATVIPTILGTSQSSRNCARNTVFSALEPLTDGTITAAQPDIYWGAYPEELIPSVRNELAGHIVPSTMLEKPMAPNVFMEAKGPDGSVAVATRQVRYDGAIGARAMHSLQNYGVEEPQYDGKPYTFSFLYHNGQLKKYSHHMTAPTTEGGRPEYHMSQVGSFAMTHRRDRFVEGATDFRNTLDLAKTYRGNFIRDANARESQVQTVAGRRYNTTEMQSTEDSADELAPTPPYYGTQAQHEEESPDELAPSPSGYLYEDDDSQDPTGMPSTGITTSFTSSFSPDQTRSKRQRSPHSQVAEYHAPKTRSRGTRSVEPSGSTRGAASVSPAESFQVRTYWKKERLCFLNSQQEEVKTKAKDWVEQVSHDGSKYFYSQGPKSRGMFWTTTLAKKPEKKMKR